MEHAVTVETPIGPVGVLVASSGERAGIAPVVSALPSGATVLVWGPVDGLSVDALAVEQALDDCHLWAVELRMYAFEATTALTVSALLAADALGGVVGSDDHSGEYFAKAVFATTDWAVALGGPDELSLAEAAEDGRQPRSWTSLSEPGIAKTHPRGLVWTLPALQAGELGRVHVAVAWAPNRADITDQLAAAVEVQPSDIRTVAGLKTRTEARRRARHT